jgi:hypothetical protein
VTTNWPGSVSKKTVPPPEGFKSSRQPATLGSVPRGFPTGRLKAVDPEPNVR